MPLCETEQTKVFANARDQASPLILIRLASGLVPFPFSTPLTPFTTAGLASSDFAFESTPFAAEETAPLEDDGDADASEPLVVDGADAVDDTLDSSSGLRFLRTSEEMSLTAPDGMEEEEEEKEEEENDDDEDEDDEGAGPLLRFLLTPIMLTPAGADEEAEDADPKVILFSPLLLLLLLFSSSALGNGAVNFDDRAAPDDDDDAPDDDRPAPEEDDDEAEPAPLVEDDGPAPLEEDPADDDPGCCFLAGLRWRFSEASLMALEASECSASISAASSYLARISGRSSFKSSISSLALYTFSSLRAFSLDPVSLMAASRMPLQLWTRLSRTLIAWRK